MVKNASGTIPGNATCVGATISVTSCGTVSGATLNDNATTTLGTEYDWTGYSGFLDAPSATRTLVQIGGQCWARYNSKNLPSNYNPSPPYNQGVDDGFSEFSAFYASGDGRLYTCKAALNNSLVERTQGVCPTGFHIPSDCEVMYLENTLGMSVADQQISAFNGSRTSGSVGTKLAPGGLSGFDMKYAGQRTGNGNYDNNNVYGFMWTSSGTAYSNKYYRAIVNGQSYVIRYFGDGLNFAARCLKD